jgi:S1-C subfamily serine protease
MKDRSVSGSWLKALLPAALVVLALPAFAVDDEADLERRLEAAQERLEEASREVAELSAELGTSLVDIVRHVDVEKRRAMLGINIGPPRDPGTAGVLIEGVTPGGPADEAGLRSGDVIVAVNGTELGTGEGGKSPERKLLDLMRDVDAGEEVSLDYERDGKRSVVKVTTEEMNPMAFAFAFSDDIREALPPDFEGFPMFHEFNSRWGNMEMVELTPALGEYFGTSEGILVVRAPNDPEIPLEDGDVIQRIDGRTPTSPSHALRILRSYQGGEQLSIEIVRKQRPMTVEVALTDKKRELRESAAPMEFDIRVPAPAVET